MDEIVYQTSKQLTNSSIILSTKPIQPPFKQAGKKNQKEHHQPTIKDQDKIIQSIEILTILFSKISSSKLLANLNSIGFNAKNTENLLSKYFPLVELQEKKNKQNRSNNRRQLLFMKCKRPDHNSPLKTRNTKKTGLVVSKPKIPQIKSKLIDIAVTNVPQVESILLLKDNRQQNTMMIKQMVTHVQQPKAIPKLPQQNPYFPGSNCKYYVAQVTQHYLIRQSLARQHIFNSIYFLQLLSKYNNTDDFARDKPINLPQREEYKNKITVVFDLDQTLVHCFEELSQPHQIQLSVTFPGGQAMIAPLNIRPHAQQLLAQLALDFQIIIFTASHQAYANAVIDHLDPRKQLVQHRLYRRHCDYIEQGYYVKDLRLLNRDLSRMVLVDNAAYSYCFQVNNGIPILPYYEGSTDYELKALKEYLYKLKDQVDVRELNSKTFKLDKYNTFLYVEQLVEQLYFEK